MIPNKQKMDKDLKEIESFVRANIDKASINTVVGWIFDIYEEGYFEGVRDYGEDDNRARKGKSN